ncbi:MAG: hypothetical protein H6711_34020 [Myxococcales bacterium]|nr:hypothetical protein [Myxococcales bacterium]
MRRTPTPAWLALLFTLACGADDVGQDTESGTSSTTEAASASATAAETDTDTGGQSCFAERHAIVTDIDETLTTADSEFVMQLLDTTYDPLERAGASGLIGDYHARGYTVVYLTARAESQASVDAAMLPARDLTEAWLIDHAFPMDDNTRLILAPGLVVGDAAAAYKAQALQDLEDEGFTFEYAYGNAASDAAGYATAGIAKDVTFIIGPEAGVDGTVAVDGEDWVAHRAAQIPTVADYCGG